MKQQTQILVLVLLAVGAGGIWLWNSRQGPSAAGAATIVSNYAPMNVDNLNVRFWVIDSTRKSEYKGSGRNPFSAVPPPPPPAPIPKPGDKGYVPPPPPPPPKA